MRNKFLRADIDIYKKKFGLYCKLKPMIIGEHESKVRKGIIKITEIDK